MLTGDIPYNQYNHDIEIQDAVLRGERPIIPNTCPKKLTKLIK